MNLTYATSISILAALGPNADAASFAGDSSEAASKVDSASSSVSGAAPGATSGVSPAIGKASSYFGGLGSGAASDSYDVSSAGSSSSSSSTSSGSGADKLQAYLISSLEVLLKFPLPWLSSRKIKVPKALSFVCFPNGHLGSVRF
ncbi:hypothetical protein KL930_001354 [Ogataea haglerorum]|uniref:uncharacterized protein n=1 Tax=Ogataea haglerorum TaxID=1937702 RepID=UPI001C89284A|nr:uncharacterized protein KL911_003755 [Ogataea haglerorum]KAG7698576.1 hypothetical protein KL951_001840 [Ogataea haglerorum]KAG7737888.1 hypothetical protein KL923_003435 [Ogataea haglerorum]KAG7747059.1 hypothetical protein KL912_003671 [Ogataea haglerorum]KAG7752473.1 hypothetical protein KL911_003755 [Ogataea haglerorum]KAG7767749.1 hypothetical protein KL931_003562 [Ogataea haglerorum]